MPLPVWFYVANSSLLLSAEKPQVPATVRGIKRKLPGTLFTSPWQSISSGGGDNRSSNRVRKYENFDLLSKDFLFSNLEQYVII